MKSNFPVLGTLVLVASLFMVACGKPPTARIGVLYRAGTPLATEIERAIALANESFEGGLVEIEYRDCGEDGLELLAAFRELVDEHVHLVVGPFESASAAVAASAAEDYRIPLLTYALAESETFESADSYVIQFGASHLEMAQALARALFARSSSVSGRSLASFANASDPVAAGFATHVEERILWNQVPISIGERHLFDPQTVDWSVDFAPLRLHSAGLFLLTGQGTDIVRALKAWNAPADGGSFLGGSGWDSPEVKRYLADGQRDLTAIMVTPFNPSAMPAEMEAPSTGSAPLSFREIWDKQYREQSPSHHGAMCFEIVRLAGEVLLGTGFPAREGDRIRDALRARQMEARLAGLFRFPPEGAAANLERVSVYEISIRDGQKRETKLTTR